jgi:hypothetical protein
MLTRLVGKSERKRTLGRRKNGLEKNIKIYLRKVG